LHLRLVSIRWLFLVVAIGCFVVGLFPQSSEWVDPANADKVSEHWLGIRLSPLYYSEHREFAQGGLRSETKTIGWLSLSGLVILLGVGGLELFRRQGNARTALKGQELGDR